MRTTLLAILAALTLGGLCCTPTPARAPSRDAPAATVPPPAPAAPVPVAPVPVAPVPVAPSAPDPAPVAPPPVEPAPPDPPPPAAPADPPPPVPAPGAVAPTDDPKLVIGEFVLAPDGVTDADTLRLVGQRQSIRLLGIDAEEVFHDKKPTHELVQLMRTDFGAYVERMHADSPLPVKYATPLGYAATDWTKAFLGAGARLRLERDVAGVDADNYGRTLCYAWVLGTDPPRLLNLELVRAGYSPYYVKYGRLVRFDAAFRAAQGEAQAARRGIWDAKGQHYPDYEQRLAWWERRAVALERFAALAAAGGTTVQLGSADALAVLAGRKGSEVDVFGLLEDHDPQAIRTTPTGTTLRVGGKHGIEVAIEGAPVVAAIRPERLRGELLRVTGVLDGEGSTVRGRERYLRIVVRSAAQITPGWELPRN